MSKRTQQVQLLPPMPKELPDFRSFLWLTWQHLRLPEPTPCGYSIALFINFLLRMLLPMTRYAQVFPIRNINDSRRIIIYTYLVMYMATRLRASLASVECANANFTEEKLICASLVQFLSERGPLTIEVFGIRTFEAL